MRALRESAQRISFGKKKSTSRQSAKKYQGHTQAIHCMQVYNGHLFTGSEDHTAMKFNVEVYQFNKWLDNINHCLEDIRENKEDCCYRPRT